jgi:cytochrome bd ubiquinol oxidase subunit II
MSNVAAVVLFIGVIAYAVFGGADFGAGFWDLTAGGAEQGREPRRLIDESLTPVWEANHVWLIFCLVMLWTGFPGVFAAIMTTLYLPLGLAALGIVVRGSGFAFRSAILRTEQQRVVGAAFALSSVLTPFFFGAVAGGIASGRAPAGGYGDPVGSWANPTSLLGGVLAVLVCASTAAIFLTAEARRRDQPDLAAWFRRRARGIAVATGAVALAGIAILHADAPRLFDDLLGRALPLVIVSALCGLASLLLVRRLGPRLVEGLAVVAVAAIVAGWGVAQYPYMLGTHSTIAESAAPLPTLVALVGVAVVAALIVAPSMGLLYLLAVRGRLEH